jgi:DNA-binding NarL/FixJ family response regulator
MAARVLIADDHYMVVEGIRSLLQHQKDIEWLGHAMNAASCLSFLQNQPVDVLFLDINLPDKSGIDLCKEVKDKYPATRVVGISSFNQLSFIEKMMENGASGYVLKNATQEELIEAIETVMDGGKFLSNEVASIVKKGPDPNVPVITRREKEVLGLIADGLTNSEIAEKLFISITTVDTHRKSLLTKFNVKNTASLIRLAMQYQSI